MGEICWQCPDFEALPEQELSFVERLPYIAAKAATLQLVNRERKKCKQDPSRPTWWGVLPGEENQESRLPLPHIFLLSRLTFSSLLPTK